MNKSMIILKAKKIIINNQIIIEKICLNVFSRSLEADLLFICLSTILNYYSKNTNKTIISLIIHLSVLNKQLNILKIK